MVISRFAIIVSNHDFSISNFASSLYLVAVMIGFFPQAFMVILLCLVSYGEICRAPRCDDSFLVIVSGCRDGLEKWMQGSHNQ